MDRHREHRREPGAQRIRRREFSRVTPHWWSDVDVAKRRVLENLESVLNSLEMHLKNSHHNSPHTLQDQVQHWTILLKASEAALVELIAVSRLAESRRGDLAAAGLLPLEDEDISCRTRRAVYRIHELSATVKTCMTGIGEELNRRVCRGPTVRSQRPTSPFHIDLCV